MAANTNRIAVIDASFVLAFLFPDEDYPEVDMSFNQFKAGLVDFITSPLLPFEVANSLNLAQRRKRIDLGYARARLKEFLDYGIEVEKVDFLESLELAQRYNLTVYDASYLYLAKKYKLELLSLDKKLLKLS